MLKVLYLGLVASLVLAPASQAKDVVYQMKDGDTLWSLSKRFRGDPYEWAQVTNLDGSPVEDVYRIPVGHTVLIKMRKLTQDKVNTFIVKHRPQQAEVGVEQKQSTNEHKPLVSRPIDNFIYLDKSTGLIRHFFEGQYVTIPVPTLVAHFQSQRKDFAETVLSNGVLIDKKLINRILLDSKLKG